MVGTLLQRLGELIDERYRLDELLAMGGMGVLYRATDLKAQRTVVVKLLRSEPGREAIRAQRFSSEIHLTAQLRHPHIVDVFDLGVDRAGTAYLVLESLKGHSLQHELALRNEPLSITETLAIVLPILEALVRVQDAGVVHRDIKPDNIFLSRGPRNELVPKLLDFGIAKVLGAETLTHEGTVGTPLYMAPEQISGKACGPGVDVWAVGAVLWQCLTGAAPFTGASLEEIGAKVLNASLPALALPGVKRTVSASIERALVRDPRKRYADARAFLNALVASAREAGVTLPPLLEPDSVSHAVATLSSDAPLGLLSSATNARRGRRAFVVAISSSLLVVGAWIGWSGWTASAEQRPKVNSGETQRFARENALKSAIHLRRDWPQVEHSEPARVSAGPSSSPRVGAPSLAVSALPVGRPAPGAGPHAPARSGRATPARDGESGSPPPQAAAASPSAPPAAASTRGERPKADLEHGEELPIAEQW